MSGYHLQSTATVFWCADLDEVDDGTAVAIYQILSADGGGGMRKLVHRDILPLPLHAAAVEVQRLLDQLETPTVILGAK